MNLVDGPAAHARVRDRTADQLLLPNQGAYTYSLRQVSIKPLPGMDAAEVISPA